MPSDPASIAAAQVRYMRRVGFTPDQCAEAIGWTVPPGVIGWDDIAEAFAHIAQEMRETLVRRALLECPKATTGGVRPTPRPADPDSFGLDKAEGARLKAFDGFEDKTTLAGFKGGFPKPARIRAYGNRLDTPRPTKWGVH